MPELGCRGQSVVAASHTPTPTDTQWPQQPSSMSTHFYPVWDHLPPRNSSTGMRTPPFEVWHVNQKIQVMSDSTITYLHIIQAARLDYYCLPFTIQCVKKPQPTCTCFHLWSFHMSPGSNTAHSGIPGLWRKSFSTPAHSTITTKQKKTWNSTVIRVNVKSTCDFCHLQGAVFVVNWGFTPLFGRDMFSFCI